ncbi:MAG: glycosyltransferase family 2 protein [Gemmatimonas sp.]
MSRYAPPVDRPDRPLVSVVIPAYNAAAFLGAAIESVLTQSLGNLEVIVVDDGSKDNTRAIAERYAQRDARVVVHHRPVSSGKPACARNDGIRLARAEVIALLDADDIATPTRFADELDAMRRTGAGVAFADVHKFQGDPPDEDTMLHPPRGVLQKSKFMLRAWSHLEATDRRHVYLCLPTFIEFMLADAIALNVQTVMFRRDLIRADEPWFDESYVGGEDIDLFYRLADRTSIVFINAVHAYMRIHSQSLTAVDTLKCMIDAADVRRLNLQRLSPKLDRAQVGRARDYIARQYFDLGYTQWINGLRPSARVAYINSFQVKPSLKTLTGYVKAFVPRGVVRKSTA